MPQTFVLPLQVTHANGEIAPAAVASFFLTGTTTPHPAYLDSTLETPVLSVQADSAGFLPKAYLDPDVTYRVRIETSSGVQIYQEDDVGSSVTQSEIGSLLYPTTDAELAVGVTPADFSYPPGVLERYGAVADDSTDCVTAISNAIAQARQANGSPVRAGRAGIYRTSTTVTLYDGVSMWGIAPQGSAALLSGIRYVGGDFVDVVAVASGEDDSISFRYWRVLGGAFRAGTARYAFYADAFHRGCEVVGCILRDCYGALKIVSGYYSSVHHNVVGLVTPDQTAGGATDAEFAQVYGATTGPVHFGEMNGSDCSHNVFQTLVSESVTATQATNAIYVSGQNVNCRGWVVESTGIDYATYSPRVDIVIRNEGYADFSGLYIERVDADDFIVGAFREAITSIVGFSMLSCNGSRIFHNQAVGDMTIDKGVCYAVDFLTSWQASSTGIGVGGDINIGPDVRVFAGTRAADVALNADTDNVYDTFGNTNTLGCADGAVQRIQRQLVCFPRVVTGLTVTNDSDANGEYIQVTSGVLLSERGTYVNAKWRTGSASSGNMAVQRLRVAASKFYRVYVGRAGSIYLAEDGSAFTDPSGDWLSSFETDGSAVIGSLTANPRLSLRGNYITGSTVCSGHRQTFAANDATPSVATGDHFVTANGSATTITDLEDPQFVGHEVFIEIADANTTVDFTGTTLKGNAGGDWTPADGDAMRCKWNGTNWLCQITDATA